jgi:hypothetical protein
MLYDGAHQEHLFNKFGLPQLGPLDRVYLVHDKREHHFVFERNKQSGITASRPSVQYIVLVIWRWVYPMTDINEISSWA